MPASKRLKEFLLDLLFPSRCLACGGELPTAAEKERALCGACRTAIAVNETLFCIACRARLAGGKRICHANTPLRLAAAGSYADPRIRALITRLKYRRQTGAIGAIAPLLETYFARMAHDFSGYSVIAVPLHAARLRRRGFNQSLLIAQEAARQLRLPLIEDGLIKIRATLPQAQTRTIRDRMRNLENCFLMQRPEAIRGKQILLIDDVCTSGTTLIEAAKALKLAGARNIIGLVIAKTD